MVHGLKTLALTLSFLSTLAIAKTLEVDTVTPSVTNGDLTLLEDGAGVISISGTGALKVSAGTGAQRPTAVNGMIRYNSDDTVLEAYVNGSWGSPAAGTLGDCQTKFLTGNSTTTGIKTDLGFDTLTLGNRYKISGLIFQAGTAFVNISHNGGILGVNQSSTTGDQATPIITPVFTATATTTTFTQGNTNQLSGNGTLSSTWLEICEVKKGSTTAW